MSESPHDVDDDIFYLLLNSLSMDVAWEMHRRAKTHPESIYKPELNLAEIYKKEPPPLKDCNYAGDIYGRNLCYGGNSSAQNNDFLEPEGTTCAGCGRIFTGVSMSTYARHLDKCLGINSGTRQSTNVNHSR